GSGGFLGKGYLQGTQGALRFLPEQDTDFAFAVFAEEWGFVCALGLLALFFLAHSAINLAIVCRLFPVVGIPLPFVSYGGSSMLTNMIALGIMANLARSRFTFQGGGERSVGA